MLRPQRIWHDRDLRHQLGEQIRIDIAAGEHDDDVLAA